MKEPARLAPVFDFDNLLIAVRRGSGSSGFGDLPGLDAGGADFHPASAALWRLHANRLQVRVEPAWGAIVRVGDIVTELRSLAADFTTFGHLVFATSVMENQGL